MCVTLSVPAVASLYLTLLMERGNEYPLQLSLAPKQSSTKAMPPSGILVSAHQFLHDSNIVTYILCSVQLRIM